MEAAEASPFKNENVKYFVKEKRLLKILGLSFSGNESIVYKIYSFLLLSCTNFMYPILQFRELFKQDFEVISDMLIYLIASYLGLAKTIVTFRNRIQVGKMLDRLEKEPFIVNLERGGVEEDKLHKECIWITNAQTRVYSTLVWATLYANISYTIINRIRFSDSTKWDLPFGPLTVLNVTHSPNYEITLFYQSISMAFIAAHFITVDLLIAAVLAHISYQFKMLQNNIRRLVQNSYTEMKKDCSSSVEPLSVENKKIVFNLESSIIPWKYLHKHLKEAVQYHLEITNLAKDMEDTFSTLLLTIFFGTLGALCFSIYRASVVQDNMKALISVFNVFTACLQVLCACYWGEQAMFESQQVSRAAYDTKFVGTDLRFQKGLVMIIGRSQTPTKLTAGKFADICLSTFAWLIRTSYSAFMLVRNISLNKT